MAEKQDLLLLTIHRKWWGKRKGRGGTNTPPTSKVPSYLFLPNFHLFCLGWKGSLYHSRFKSTSLLRTSLSYSEQYAL